MHFRIKKNKNAEFSTGGADMIIGNHLKEKI